MTEIYTIGGHVFLIKEDIDQVVFSDSLMSFTGVDGELVRIRRRHICAVKSAVYPYQDALRLMKHLLRQAVPVRDIVRIVGDNIEEAIFVGKKED